MYIFVTKQDLEKSQEATPRPILDEERQQDPCPTRVQGNNDRDNTKHRLGSSILKTSDSLVLSIKSL